MVAKNRPDSILFVLAYLIFVALGGLLGALVVFAIVLPEIQNLGTAEGAAAVTMVGLGALSLLVTVAALFAAQGLWRGQAAGRASTVILAAILVLVCVLAIPTLLLVGIAGIALVVPLASALVLLITSGAVLMATMRPSTKEYFQ